MVFSSPAFLFLFLPLVLLSAVWGAERWRNLVLIVWSLWFYYYGGGWMVVLLVVSCLVNWAFGLGMELRRSRWLLGLALGFNVGVLGYYKYANFVVGQISGWYPVAGWEAVALPIGISFFTFQGISYVMDVWRGEMKAFRNPLEIVLCVTFFPHLIAGPIVRLSHLSEQLRRREQRWDDVAVGAARFVWGLGKKVLIADVCSRVADSGFDGNLERLPASGAWLSLLAYTLQIYFDFSGYSDMAIGLARMFGFRFPENFNHPYAAVSVTDFWRRWHMSLSQWFRDYLYIPLGGNRGGTWQTYRNLAVVFLVTGLWHGAAWTFVCWGAYHGVMLMVERATGLARVGEDRWAVVRRVLTLVVVMGSWAIFRVPDGERGLEFFRALMGEGNRWGFPGAMVRLMDVQTMAALGVGAMALVVPRGWMTMGMLLEREDEVAARARAVVLLVLFPVVLVQVLASGYSPFLYFQF